MKWKMEDELIFDGDRLVGSLVMISTGKGQYQWSVEILWSPSMDIKFKTDSLEEAKGFIEGVETTFVALGVKEKSK